MPTSVHIDHLNPLGHCTIKFIVPTPPVGVENRPKINLYLATAQQSCEHATALAFRTGKHINLKIDLKTFPNSIKHLPKIVQNRRHNGPKSMSGRGLAGWLLKPIGASWSCLGASWKRHEASWARLGASWGCLGVS